MGIAICDPDRRLASPLEVFQRKGAELEGAYFRELAKREQILGWVVGLPVHEDGRESESSARARLFARWLRQTTLLPVRLFDERHSTKNATSRLQPAGLSRRKNRQRLDAVAAQVLLESFLEATVAHPEGIAGRSADGPLTTEEPLS
jgi:putative Holliday junction resolvase